MTTRIVNQRLVSKTPETLEEWIETVKAEILTKIGDLEDQLEALRKLFDRIDQITCPCTAETVFKETGAWFYYCLTDFRILTELADNYEYIKMGEY